MPDTFFAGGGQCGDRVRAYDWASTSIGPITSWPQSLRTTVGLVLLSHVPMVLLWGADGVMIYNDAYAIFAGGRHPQLLGSTVREGWPEVADFNDTVMRAGLAGGTLSYKDQELTLHRHDRPEQVWMNLDYSPVLDESGRPAGVLCILAETSDHVAAERRRAAAETAVRDSEERFRALVDASNDVVYRMSPDWTELRHLDGRGLLTNADGPSGGWTETYLFPEDRPRVLAAIHEAVRTQSAFELEHRVRRADGSPGLIFSRAVPVIDEAGRLVEWFGAASDVTARDRAQAERIASDERLRAALDASDTGTFRWDIRTNALDWDEALDRLFGLAPGETARSLEQFIALVHPDDRAGVIERCGACAAEGADFEMEFRVVRPDGRLRWLYDRGKTFRDPDGSPSYMAGACVDITERKVAEVRLLETTRRLDAVLSNTTQAIFLMDERQHCMYMNRAAEALTGFSLDEVLARDCPLHDVVHHTRPNGAPYPLCECPIDQAFPENNQEQGEEIFVHKDGSFYPVGFTASPIRDETGRPIGTVIEARNIEAELRDRAALESFNARLERRVAEEIAARESVEAALRQSQKMEAVGQLTGGLAHDFNNLLAGISGSLELMQARLSQGRLTDLDRYMTAAQGAAKRAAALTHRLLAFSRRQTLDPKPTNVNALVAGMEELIRRTVGPEITVEVVGAAGLWTARVDPPQLENALLNLCINARDAMPEGGRITVETANRWLDDRAAKERDLPPGQYLSLCISDSGTGMTPDVIAKAFDPFFTTKPIGQGTGLGLSMIYGFVRQSGGQVRIYSEVGQGTTVCLYLPRHHGEVGEADDLPDLAGAPRAEHGETVLIVDDEPTVRMLVTEVLEDLGYRAIEAADGPSGLRVLQSDVRIDLLVTDVGLPGGMNGRQMADAGRVKRPDLKVLFITGYAENAAVGNGHLEAGMAVLTKPFVMETLATRIREMIEG